MGFANPDTSVAKGPVTYCLDTLSVQKDARKRLERLREEIKGLKDKDFCGLEKVLGKHLLAHCYSDSQKLKRIIEYLEDYWFCGQKNWWPHFQPIAPIYARGLLKALNASLSVDHDQPLPIDSYWIIGHCRVELLTLVNERQVTLLIVTPSPVELTPKGIWGESAEAWITTRRSGTVPNEVDPTENDKKISKQTDLRVCTFKVETKGP